MQQDIVLETKKIIKKFGDTIALNVVDINLYRGEIRGLIGENGSGKSTFSSIIAGIHKSYEGEIVYKGQLYKPESMIGALRDGIGMVVQEKGTIPNITVAENLFLGEIARFSKFGIVNKRALFRSADEALKSIGITHISSETMIHTLDMQDRKLIEIAKVIYKDPDIFIVDETTTALSYRGREILYQLMNDLKARNKSVLLISHDINELMDKCDTLTVLRDGNLISHLKREEFEENYIKQLLVGREMTGSYFREDFNYEVDEEVVLSVKNVNKEKELVDLSFNLHKGEILGIGGLSDCGMHTLGKCIFGFERPESGSIIIRNNIEIKNERQAMNEGLGYLSKDRDVEALSLNTSIRDNISIAGLDLIKRKSQLIFSKDEKEYVQKQINAFNIKCTSMDQYVQNLSGGNKQKVVFGKWVGRGSNILVLDCPTRGVDIGVKQAMYQLIIKLKDGGKSFILISEELSELIGLSDRILIMKDGKVTKEFYRHKDLSESDIINYMI